MKKHLITLGLSLAVIGFLSGCSQSDEPKEEKEATSEVERKIANKLDFENLYPDEEIRNLAKEVIGKKAPEFTVKNIAGESVSLEDYKGKNVVLEVASTTCSSCMEAYPKVKEFRDNHLEDVNFLTVFPNQSEEDVALFLKNLQAPSDNDLLIADNMSSLMLDYGVKYTPSFYFIDKEGYIQYFYVGSDFDSITMASMSDLAFGTNLSEFYKVVE